MTQNTFIIKAVVILLFCFLTTKTSAQNLTLLPPIPEPATNPHISTLFSGLNVTSTAYSDGEIYTAALAYLHPNSPYKGQPGVLNRWILLCDSAFTRWSKNILVNDMAMMYPGLSYLMLKTYLPDKIPADKKAMWETQLKKDVTALLKNTNLYDKRLVGAVWLNGDIRQAFNGYFCALAVDDTVSAKKIRYAIDSVMTKTLLGDGGTHYVGYQNESPTYHPPVISTYCRYYAITRSQAALDFLKRTANYIPSVTVPIGLSYYEYSTSPAWKPYYNAGMQKVEALAVAYLSGDGFNYGIGKGQNAGYHAFIYRSGLTAKSLPDNYMFFDKNIQGPRGRYGAWTITGSGRDVSRPGPELTETAFDNMDGMNTLAGAAILNETATSGQYPINAVFHGTAPEVKPSKGIETDWNRGNYWACLTGKDGYYRVTRTQSVYGLSARYDVSKMRYAETSWDGKQLWVFTPDRVIGLSEIESTASSTVFGLANRIVLTAGRSGQQATYKPLLATGENEWNFGKLRFKIHQKDYVGKIEMFKYGIWSADTLSLMIKLHDKYSGKDSAVTYPSGTKRYALMESTYSGKTYATGVTRLPDNNSLINFQFTEAAGRKIRIIFNPTAAARTYTDTMACPYGKARVVKSWDETSVGAVTVSAAKITIPSLSIPAYGHILVINSDIAEDHLIGYKEYESVFAPTLSATPSALKATAGNKSVSLTWPDALGALSYTIKRAETPGGTYTQIASGITGLSYTDSGLTNGKTYYYVITAVNKAGETANSNEVSAVPWSGVNAVSAAQNNNFRIYPLPAKDFLCVENAEDSIISLVDGLGKTVFSKSGNRTLFTIPLSGIGSGIYFLKIEKDGVSYCRKVVHL